MGKYEKNPSKMFKDIDEFYEKLKNASTINSNIMKLVNNNTIRKRTKKVPTVSLNTTK